MRKHLLLFLFLASLTLHAQSFKVIGYLPTYRFNYLSSIEFDKVTHVNIAFANPDTLGNLSCDGVDITPAVTKAHQHNCQVFISLAGGAETTAQEAAWNSLMAAAKRPAFIQKIVQYVQTHQLDGVDVDIEWQYVTSLYSPFIVDLKNALAQIGKPLSAALPGSYRYPQVTNQALAAFDWVNMMVYDLTGPWDPTHPGQHSPYTWAQQCIQYWEGQNVPSSKLTLGVPFYGYDFGVSPVNAFTYRNIVLQDIANAQLDESGLKYWNGIPTIQAKTQLALNEVAGIMIWELGEDAFGSIAQYSLLKAINAVVHPAAVDTGYFAPALLQLYPNPASDQLTVQMPGSSISRIRVFDMSGQLVLDQVDPGTRLDVAQLPTGVYGMRIEIGAQVIATRFIRI
jgi:GH18 family chitinase